MIYEILLNLDQVIKRSVDFTLSYLDEEGFDKDLGKQVVKWNPGNIQNPEYSIENSIPEDLEEPFYRMFELNLEDRLKYKSDKFAATIGYYCDGDQIIRTRIFDASLLKSVVDISSVTKQEYSIDHQWFENGFFRNTLGDERYSEFCKEFKMHMKKK